MPHTWVCRNATWAGLQVCHEDLTDSRMSVLYSVFAHQATSCKVWSLPASVKLFKSVILGTAEQAGWPNPSHPALQNCSCSRGGECRQTACPTNSTSTSAKAGNCADVCWYSRRRPTLHCTRFAAEGECAAHDHLSQWSMQTPTH